MTHIYNNNNRRLVTLAEHTSDHARPSYIYIYYMNEGIHLDLDTWIVPGQIRKANLCRGLGNRYTLLVIT